MNTKREIKQIEKRFRAEAVSILQSELGRVQRIPCSWPSMGQEKFWQFLHAKERVIVDLNARIYEMTSC